MGRLAGLLTQLGEVRMRRIPISAKECRLVAAQCQRWATRAKNDEHKKIMVERAHHWTHAAEQLEREARPTMSFGKSRQHRRVRGHAATHENSGGI
jgi:hypothetical protein